MVRSAGKVQAGAVTGEILALDGYRETMTMLAERR
jgi:hypothetical protein